MSSEIFSKGRLESLTDGVFAIIMTILVFNVSVPELVLFAEGEHTSERLSSRLLDLWPDILAYIVSFVTLSVYWVAHHRIFRWIVNVDHPLIWMNISFLMTIGLIPFSTALLTQYRDQQISIFIYSSNAILAGAIIYSLYHYAKGHLELVDKTVHSLFKNRSGRRVLITILTYSVAISISFIYLPVSLFLFLLVLLPEFIPDRFFGKEK
jgi:TMEM175 potassium channel family protein